MHFCSSHIYLVIMVVKRVKPFMFLFFFIRTNPVLFQISKMSGPSTDEVNPTLSSLLCYDLLLYSNMSSCLSYLSWPFLPQKYCLYTISWMILLLLSAYPYLKLLLVEKWYYEVCILECTQNWPDMGSSISSRTITKLFNWAEPQFLIILFDSDLLLTSKVCLFV